MSDTLRLNPLGLTCVYVKPEWFSFLQVSHATEKNLINLNKISKGDFQWLLLIALPQSQYISDHADSNEHWEAYNLFHWFTRLSSCMTLSFDRSWALSQYFNYVDTISHDIPASLLTDLYSRGYFECYHKSAS